MPIVKYLIMWGLAGALCFPGGALGGDMPSYGPLYHEFPLTLAPGHRTEFMGPLFFSELKDTQKQWGIPPLGLSHTFDPDVEYEEYDFLYPLLTYDRFGAEYRWQFFQLLSFAGGQNQDETNTHRFTLFPIYFQQRSDNPETNYTALVPFYGHLDHRFFRDEIDFVMFPLYSKTRKRDVYTWNMPYPIFHLREGEGLSGWQFWPFASRERKGVTTDTNGFGEFRIIGGHDKRFYLWPIYTDTKTGLGTDFPVHQQGLIPFYTYYRSPPRDSTTYFWPLGVTHTIDREKGFTEWDAPWPFIEFARGEGKTTSRVFPFFSQAHNQYLTDNWYIWPLYKYNRVTSAPLDRERTRILFFLYSSVIERNTETGKARQRRDFLPFYTWQKDFNGNERLQVFSVFEPFFPTSKSIERDYGPLLAVWRSENNPRTGAASRSFMWNLYRRDVTPDTKKISLLFGLIQYQSGAEGSQWRICYLRAGGTAAKKSGEESKR